MKLIIIAAYNKKRVIGRNGKIPWDIPADRKRFKEITTGHAVLMGRKTFESIGAPLSGRRNIILTHNPRFQPSLSSGTVEHPVTIFHSLDEAFGSLRQDQKGFIIGGGELYRQTIARADEMFLTVVNNEEDGDTFFPEFGNTAETGFHEQSRITFPDHAFLHYVRIQKL